MQNPERDLSLVQKSISDADQFLESIETFLPKDYALEGGFIVHTSYPTKGDPIETKVCSPLAITAQTRSDNGKEGGLLVKWIDRDDNLREWVFPQTLLAEDFKRIASNLQRNMIKYLPTAPKARGLFMECLQTSYPIKRILYTEKTGWNGSSFVLPDLVIGDKEIVFQATSTKFEKPKIVGTVTDWQKKIGKYCIGNPTLTIGASAGFAAILGGLLGIDGFLLHLIGQSSSGKTISLGVQCSILGQKKGSWRGTDNAKESEFEAHNHIGITLDELGQSTIKDASQIIYMLGNGEGKARANADGSAQAVKTFSVMGISTGELTLEQFFSLAGKKITGGLSVRCIQGHSDNFKYRCFDNLHNFESAEAFAVNMEQATGLSGDSYTPEAAGAIGIAFIKWLTTSVGSDVNNIATIKKRITDLADKITPEGADAQVSRMAKSMALVMVAGEMATKAGLTGWPKGAAIEECNRWWKECALETRGSISSTESKNELEQVTDFFLTEANKHFARAPKYGHGQAEEKLHGSLYGYQDEHKGKDVYLVNAAGWKVICKGVDHKRALKLLLDKGLLLGAQTDSEGKSRLNVRKRFNNKQSWYYIISQEITAI